MGDPSIEEVTEETRKASQDANRSAMEAISLTM
jgi:hypothetical protein